MALKIIGDTSEHAGARIKVDRRLYLDAAGELVEADDPTARSLYASAGKEVSRVEFEALGGEIVDPEPAERPAEAADEPPAKPAKKKAKKKAAKKKAKKKKA